MLIIHTETPVRPEQLRESDVEQAGQNAVRIGTMSEMFTIPKEATLIITDRLGSGLLALFDQYESYSGGDPWECSERTESDPTGTIPDRHAYGWYFSRVTDPELFVDKLNRWQTDSDNPRHRNKAAPLQQE